jgi:hypothetical protein
MRGPRGEVTLGYSHTDGVFLCEWKQTYDIRYSTTPVGKRPKESYVGGLLSGIKKQLKILMPDTERFESTRAI